MVVKCYERNAAWHHCFPFKIGLKELGKVQKHTARTGTVSIRVTIKQMQTCQTRKVMTEEGYATHSLWRWTGNECSLSDNKFKTKKGRYFTQRTAECWESFPQDPKLLSLHYVQKAMGQQHCLAAQWQTPVFAKFNSFFYRIFTEYSSSSCVSISQEGMLHARLLNERLSCSSVIQTQTICTDTKL